MEGLHEQNDRWNHVRQLGCRCRARVVTTLSCPLASLFALVERRMIERRQKERERDLCDDGYHLDNLVPTRLRARQLDSDWPAGHHSILSPSLFSLYRSLDCAFASCLHSDGPVRKGRTECDRLLLLFPIYFVRSVYITSDWTRRIGLYGWFATTTPCLFRTLGLICSDGFVLFCFTVCFLFFLFVRYTLVVGYHVNWRCDLLYVSLAHCSVCDGRTVSIGFWII